MEKAQLKKRIICDSSQIISSKEALKEIEPFVFDSGDVKVDIQKED